MNNIRSSAIYSAIPSGWKIVPLSKLLRRVKKPVEVEANRLYREIGILSHGKGIFHKEERTGASLGNKSVYWVEPGCFVVNIVFAWEQAIAKTTDAEKGMIASHRFPMYKPKTGTLDLDFLAFFFNTPQGKYLLGLASPGGAGRNKTLGQQAFLDLAIPLPPFLEQRKITDILSAVDRAIALTERRIEAARQRKKGLMQRLLTGRVRFPEFQITEWVTCRMQDLLKPIKRPIKWSDTDTYNLISIKRRSGGLFLRQTTSGRDIKTKQMNVAHARDFLISKMQVVHGAWAVTPPEFDGMHISNSYIALVPRDQSKLDIGYFDWLSRMPHMYHLAYVSSVGVHIEKMRFDLQDFLKHKITIPGDIREQRRITAVLNACDHEIELLIQKRDALQRQKKGLMQRLLTGRVRVTVEKPWVDQHSLGREVME